MPILEAIFQHKFCSTKARKNGVVVDFPKGSLYMYPWGPWGRSWRPLKEWSNFLKGQLTKCYMTRRFGMVFGMCDILGIVEYVNLIRLSC